MARPQPSLHRSLSSSSLSMALVPVYGNGLVPVHDPRPCVLQLPRPRPRHARLHLCPWSSPLCMATSSSLSMATSSSLSMVMIPVYSNVLVPVLVTLVLVPIHGPRPCALGLVPIHGPVVAYGKTIVIFPTCGTALVLVAVHDKAMVLGPVDGKATALVIADATCCIAT